MLRRFFSIFVVGYSVFSTDIAFSVESSSLQEQVNSMYKEMQTINERLDLLEYNIKMLSSNIKSSGQNVHRNENSETEEGKLDDDSERQMRLSEDKFEKEKREYELALASLKSGDLEKASKSFEEFIARYEDSKFLANAYFWYAETLNRQGDFKKATIFFLKSYKKDNKGPKSADALLKLAFVLSNMNDKTKTNQACSVLFKIQKEFPMSSSSLKANVEELKQKLDCKK